MAILQIHCRFVEKCENPLQSSSTNNSVFAFDVDRIEGLTTALS